MQEYLNTKGDSKSLLSKVERDRFVQDYLRLAEQIER